MREDSFFDNSSIQIITSKSYLLSLSYKPIIMPFTVSHIVAALPLNKGLGKFSKYTALSPLIIGSMTPDIAYLTPFLVHQRMDSHSLIGLYLFCIPMGLTIYFLYHLLMAPVVVSCLPKSIQRHMNSDLFIGKLPTTPAHVIIISLILGALTHIIWDFFTHNYGIPQHITWMAKPLTYIDSFHIMPARVLQFLSSILGLVLLIYLVYRWYQDLKHRQGSDSYWHAPQKLKILAIIILLTASFIGALLNGYKHLPEADLLHGIYRAKVLISHSILGGAGSFLLSSFALGLLYRLLIKRSLKH